MIGVVYYVLTGSINLKVILASIPYGLMVMLVLFRKHLDKYDMDYVKKIKTPLILLESNKWSNMISLKI